MHLVQIEHGNAVVVYFVGPDVAAVPLYFVVGVGVAGVLILSEDVVVALQPDDNFRIEPVAQPIECGLLVSSL